MKKQGLLFVLLTVTGLFFSCSKDQTQDNNMFIADKPQNSIMLESGKGGSCTTLQDGKILYSTGHYLASQPIPVGYDAYGYNYQAHMFNGSYANVYLGGYGFPPYKGDDATYLKEYPTAATLGVWQYRNVNLEMKWNDAWISNKDCDDDGKLDRHYGFNSYIGSGAWETNHMSGTYDDNGKKFKWVDFVKIIAVPEDATLKAGVWNAADGTEIGPVIWGEFATIQEIYNDPGAGFHGKLYISPDHPGFGGW